MAEFLVWQIIDLAFRAFHGSYLPSVAVGVKTSQLVAINLNPGECC